MRRIVYDIALGAFPVLLQMARPFHKKAKLMIDGRKNWQEDLSKQHLPGKRIWIHCASLGEFEQGRPLIEKIRKQFPGHSIIITFFSSSGYEVRKDFSGADYVCYLPFDGKVASNKFIDLLQPDLAVFVKYEFWYHYLNELKQRQIPVFSVSAIFRSDQEFFKKRGHFFREMLSCFNHLFVQNRSSKELLNQYGFNKVTISGDTRFDRVVEICSNPKHLDIVTKFKNGKKLMVIGSSWPDDMEVLYSLINNEDHKLKYLIAPHEIGMEKVAKLCSKLEVEYQMLSNANEDTISSAKVLVIDSIGLLSSLYQYGELAYIGGAFGDGLHNILEAATFGMPILFGKGKDNYKFQEAIDLVEKGGAFEVENAEELSSKVEQLTTDQELLSETSRICKEYVLSKTGATDTIMNYLRKFLE